MSVLQMRTRLIEQAERQRERTCFGQQLFQLLAENIHNALAIRRAELSLGLLDGLLDFLVASARELPMDIFDFVGFA